MTYCPECECYLGDTTVDTVRDIAQELTWLASVSEPRLKDVLNDMARRLKYATDEDIDLAPRIIFEYAEYLKNESPNQSAQ